MVCFSQFSPTFPDFFGICLPIYSCNNVLGLVDEVPRCLDSICWLDGHYHGSEVFDVWKVVITRIVHSHAKRSCKESFYVFRNILHFNSWICLRFHVTDSW